MIQHNTTPENLLVEDTGKDTDFNDVNQLQSGFKVADIKADTESLLNNETSTENKYGITAEELLKKSITQIPCLVEPFLQQTGLACLAGSSDTGKSSLLRQLAISITTCETNFLGFKINPKHQSVIYVSTEDLELETSYLLQRQAGKYKPELLKGLSFVFEANDLKNTLDNMLSSKPTDLIIIDCFADIFSGDLKDTHSIRTFLHSYQELAQKHNCLVLFLHHTGKRTENLEPSKNNLLSGQGFEAKMRLVIELRVDLVNPNKRHLCIVKGNYLSAKHKKESYVLNFDEETFTYSNTGERTPFELLVKKQPENHEKAKYFEAKSLKERGYNYEQIAERIGYAVKSSVSKLLTKGKEKGWDKEVSKNVSIGNETETDTQN